MESPNILIFGAGKLSYALQSVFSQYHTVHTCTRNDFDALCPDSAIRVLEKYTPNIVFNTTVYGGIDACAVNPMAAYQVNTLFPLFLAKQSALHHFTFVHFSTEAVFADVALQCRHLETDACCAPNIYGATKCAADSLVLHASVGCYVFRLPLLFGYSLKKNQFFEKILALGCASGKLRISQDIFSTPVYSADVALKIQEMLQTSPPGLYHLASPEACSLLQLVEYAVNVLALDICVEGVDSTEFPVIDSKNLRPLIASAKTSCLPSWQQGVEAYCRDCAEYLSAS